MAILTWIGQPSNRYNYRQEIATKLFGATLSCIKGAQVREKWNPQDGRAGSHSMTSSSTILRVFVIRRSELVQVKPAQTDGKRQSSLWERGRALRLCVGNRNLHSLTFRNSYPFLYGLEYRLFLGDTTSCSTMDMNRKIVQVEIVKVNREKTVLDSPHGLY